MKYFLKILSFTVNLNLLNEHQIKNIYINELYLIILNFSGTSDSYNRESELESSDVEDTPSSGMPTSELILTVFRTALDVIRNINKNRAAAALPSPKINSTAVQVRIYNYMAFSYFRDSKQKRS